MNRIEEREKVLDSLLNSNSRNAEEIKAVERVTNNIRDDVRSERRHQFIISAGLYAILGAVFATMLAQELLQGIVIGGGWTAYMGALGLKSDYAERKAVKDDATAKLEEVLSKLEQGELSDSDKLSLMSEVAVARAL